MYMVTSRRERRPIGRGKYNVVTTYYVMPISGKFDMGPYTTREEASRVCGMLNGA